MSIWTVWVSDQVNLRVDPTWKVSAPSCVQARSAATKEGVVERSVVVERRRSVAAADAEEGNVRDRMLYCVNVCLWERR